MFLATWCCYLGSGCIRRPAGCSWPRGAVTWVLVVYGGLQDVPGHVVLLLLQEELEAV